MKSLVEHINEAMVVEASLFDGVSAEDDYEGACDYVEGLATQLENVKPAQLKRVFKDLDNKVLNDYCKCLEEIAAWINGVMSLARDEESEADMYIEMVSALGDDYSGAVENVCDNLQGNLDTAEDGQTVYDYVEDIFQHWQEISKVVFKKTW